MPGEGMPVLSHSRMVLSRLPLARVVPSGLNATLLTESVCPVRMCLCSPVFTFHSRIFAPSQWQGWCTERHAIDPTYMPSEGMPVCACAHVPQPNSSVPTPSGKGGAVRTERHAPDPICMSGEGALMFSRVHIPQNGLVQTPTSKSGTI